MTETLYPRTAIMCKLSGSAIYSRYKFTEHKMSSVRCSTDFAKIEFNLLSITHVAKTAKNCIKINEGKISNPIFKI